MNKKIILIEDDLAIIDIYETILKKNHFEVEVISSGSTALSKIKEIASGGQEAPAIILLDLILPDINGVEILKEIRANDTTKHIKVFIFSNQEDMKIQLEGLRPDKFIVKASITPTDLVKIIREEIG